MNTQTKEFFSDKYSYENPPDLNRTVPEDKVLRINWWATELFDVYRFIPSMKLYPTYEQAHMIFRVYDGLEIRLQKLDNHCGVIQIYVVFLKKGLIWHYEQGNRWVRGHKIHARNLGREIVKAVKQAFAAAMEDL